jgi:hypothetical protein
LFFLLFISERLINKSIFNSRTHSIIGHSHPAVGLDPKKLTNDLNEKVLNHARPGQSMFWSIIGAKKLSYQGCKLFFIEITNSTYTSD